MKNFESAANSFVRAFPVIQDQSANANGSDFLGFPVFAGSWLTALALGGSTRGSLRPVSGATLFDAFVGSKRGEFRNYHTSISDWEVEHYLEHF